MHNIVLSNRMREMFRQISPASDHELDYIDEEIWFDGRSIAGRPKRLKQKDILFIDMISWSVNSWFPAIWSKVVYYVFDKKGNTKQNTIIQN